MFLQLVVMVWSASLPGQAKPVAPVAIPKPDHSADKDKKLCRMEDVTGSLFPKRVCSTKAEWAAVDSERNRGVDGFNNRLRSRGPGSLSE